MSESEKSQITKLLFSVVLFFLFFYILHVHRRHCFSLFSLSFNFMYVLNLFIYCGMYINMQYVYNMSFTSSPSSRPLSLHLFWLQRLVICMRDFGISFYQLSNNVALLFIYVKFPLFFLIKLFQENLFRANIKPNKKRRN